MLLLKHDIKMHKKVHCPCNICEMKFKTKIDLIRHREKHTKNEKEDSKMKSNGLNIKTLQTNAIQKSITAFYNKKFWDTTEKDIDNKKNVERSR